MEHRTQRLARIVGKMNKDQRDAFEVSVAAICAALFLASMFLMTGCGSLNPTLSYDHISDPRISNDGFDLVCGGAQHETHGLMLHAGACKDVTGYKGEYLRAGVRYVWE